MKFPMEKQYKIDMAKDYRVDKPLSRNQAIKAKCLNCSNWQKTEIRLCPVYECSLYPWRPYKMKEEKEGSKN